MMNTHIDQRTSHSAVKVRHVAVAHKELDIQIFCKCLNLSKSFRYLIESTRLMTSDTVDSDSHKTLIKNVDKKHK